MAAVTDALISDLAKRRRVWDAALLSVLLPGLGQLYNQQVGWALALLATSFAMVPIQFLIVHLPPSAGVIVYAGLVVVRFGAWLVAIVQAAIAARRTRAIQLAWYNRFYVYAVLIVAAVAWQVMLPLSSISMRTSYNIPSGSMVPSLLVGDYLEARTLAFHSAPPRRGEIAFYLRPSDETGMFVSRIVGLPGDRIQMREGRLYINDVAVERSRIEDFRDQSRINPTPVPQYIETLPGGVSHRILETLGDSGMLDDTQVFTVPAGHVFMMGDNRDASADSREDLGPVPIGLLRDKPLFLYWSSDLGRIGKVVE